MRIGTASVRRRAQLLALEPTLSVEPLRGNIDTRLRKARERGLDALVLAACGLDRLGLDGEIGLRLPVEHDAARGGTGRARAAGARGRGGARGRRRRTRRRAGGSRPSAPASRRSAPAASRRSPPTTTATQLTALIAAEDGSWIERRSGDDPGRARRRAARGGGASGRREGDRHPAARPGAAAGRAARGARPRGRRVPADRDRPHLRRADRLRRLRVAGRDEPERRRRDRPAGARTCRRSRPSGPGTAETLRGHGIEPDFVAGGVVAGRAAAPSSRGPGGPVLFAAAENSRRGPIDELGADFVPLYRTAAPVARAARGGRRRARVGLGGAGATPGSAARRRRCRSAPRRAASRARSGSRSPSRPSATTSTGSSRRCAASARVPLGVYDSITFLTDFGLQDDFVGVCHGVIKRIAPRRAGARPDARHRAAGGDAGRAHARPRGAVPARSASISRSSTRASAATAAGVAIRTRDGRVYVGPDNGLLTLAAAAARIVAARDADEPALPPRARLAHLPRPGHLRPGRRAPRERRPTSTISATRSTPPRSSASSCRSRRSSTASSARPCSTSTASATSG